MRACQDAGVTVRMVTGDLLNTAKSIARQCNILTKDGVAMEGKVFRSLSDQQAYEVLPKLQVLARSTPQVLYSFCTGPNQTDLTVICLSRIRNSL